MKKRKIIEPVTPAQVILKQKQDESERKLIHVRVVPFSSYFHSDIMNNIDNHHSAFFDPTTIGSLRQVCIYLSIDNMIFHFI